MINLHRHILYRPLQAIAVVVSVLTASTAWAADCSPTSVSIKSIETSPLNGLGSIYTSPPSPIVYATSCEGLFSGNDYGGGTNIPLSSGGNIDPINNIGQLNDGLLNGGGGILSPTWFQNPTYPSPMLNIDGVGDATDPGWIRLGKIDINEDTSDQEFSYDSSTNLDGETLTIGPIYNTNNNRVGVVDIAMECDDAGCLTGTWSLETSIDIVDIVQDLLGRNAFDHLAIVLKSSSWFGVYDFDFNILSQGLGDDFNFKTAYSFTGEWDMKDFINNGGQVGAISHISLWARDPFPNDVPEPASLALLGLGLFGLGLVRRRRAS